MNESSARPAPCRVTRNSRSSIGSAVILAPAYSRHGEKDRPNGPPRPSQFIPTISIYATLWSIRFPKAGYPDAKVEWVEVTAQAVPPHIGSPTPSEGYEDGDPYAAFLPPPVETDGLGDAPFMRAVVIIARPCAKGTPRSSQEYPDPLLVLTGREYAASSFEELQQRINCQLHAGSDTCS